MSDLNIEKEVAELSPERRKLFERLLRKERLDVSRLLTPTDELLRPLKEVRTLPESVFLTGATGYLGCYILHEILGQTEATVHCLVRAVSEEEGRKRISEQLAWYFPESELSDSLTRIKPVVGDIRSPSLGIAAEEYQGLCDTIDLIYHAAAEVRFIGNPTHFRAVNVDGTRSVIELAQTGKQKLLHHISTTLISGTQSSSEIKTFSERDFDINQDLGDSPYVQSKFFAERVVREAMTRGCRAVVHRTGAISADSRTGRFQRNIHENGLYRTLRAILKTGIAPYVPEASLNIIPVDFIANAIVTLSFVPHTEGLTFHHVNPKELGYYDLIRMLHAFGYSIRLVNPSEYMEKSLSFASEDGGYQSDLININENLFAGAKRPVRIEAAFTQGWLKRLELVCPPPNPYWLSLMVQHCINVEYIPPPIHWGKASSIPELF